jgi:cysteine desulfurase
MESIERVYLDHNATTPVDPEVFKAMVPYLTEVFGNPSSLHSFGRCAKRAVDNAREKIADLISAKCSEIFFTSGGTEADNFAIRGVALANKERGDHIVTSAIEHHAVLSCVEELEKEGFSVTYIEPDKDGILSPQDVVSAISDRTILVSIMCANNETGVIQPIKDIGEEIERYNSDRPSTNKVYFHTDAVQAVGKIPFDVDDLFIDLASISAHKIYGPKGVGALYIREGTRISSIIVGGPHEREKRAGTENVAGIVGFGRAAELASSFSEIERIKNLRDMLENGILEKVKNVRINGNRERRLPNTTSISFLGCVADSLIVALDNAQIAASSGSACSSSSDEASHVLLAMGLSREEALSAIRFSIGKGNTEEEIDYCLKVLPEIVERLRGV